VYCIYRYNTHLSFFKYFLDWPAQISVHYFTLHYSLVNPWILYIDERHVYSFKFELKLFNISRRNILRHVSLIFWEQLKWSLAFRLYIGSFPCAQLPGPVHTARLGRLCFCVFSLGLCFVLSFVFLWFVYVSSSLYVSLNSWVISLTVLCAGVTNLNEPPRALATSTIMWVRS